MIPEGNHVGVTAFKKSRKLKSMSFLMMCLAAHPKRTQRLAGVAQRKTKVCSGRERKKEIGTRRKQNTRPEENERFTVPVHAFANFKKFASAFEIEKFRLGAKKNFGGNGGEGEQNDFGAIVYFKGIRFQSF
jgi:hypothetical protein